MMRISGREGEDPRIYCFFKGSHPGGVSFRVRDVGPDPLCGAVPGQLPAKGHATDHQEASKEAVLGGWGVVSSNVGSNGGSGF